MLVDDLDVAKCQQRVFAKDAEAVGRRHGNTIERRRGRQADGRVRSTAEYKNGRLTGSHVVVGDVRPNRLFSPPIPTLCEKGGDIVEIVHNIGEKLLGTHACRRWR